MMKAEYKRVALRKESVDRNLRLIFQMSLSIKSLSARRAWIEIPQLRQRQRKTRLSLSARRAWIEMLYGGNMKLYCAGRSPQGERG